MGNVYTKIKFNNKMIKWPFEFCQCPRDFKLLRKAVEQTNGKYMSSIFSKKYELIDYLKLVGRKFTLARFDS